MGKARRLSTQIKSELRRISGVSSSATTSYPRVSSFPFVSGDTFRLLAGVEFLESGQVPLNQAFRRIGFVKSDLVQQPGFLKMYSDWVGEQEGDKPILLIHNSDILPADSLLDDLAKISKAIFCVNLIRERNNLHALPIGLENASLNTNGRMSLYLGGYDQNPELRARKVLSSFHVETNPRVRQPLRDLMEKSRFGYDGYQWKLGEYRSELRKTKFVICPPGNGSDTHRTWEAIYLGAVPVVLADSLASSLSNGLPILAVSSFESFLEKTDAQLDHLYEETIIREADKAYFPYWVELIRGLL